MKLQGVDFNSIGNSISKLNNEKLLQLNSANKVDFGKLLNNAIEEIDDANKISTAFDEMIITGEVDNLHDPFIASKKAEILFSFGLEVRAQVLDAYRELMRMQL